MLPQDPRLFEPVAGKDWLVPDRAWFSALAAADPLTVVERVHLARLAVQQQWAADIEDTANRRQALQELGLSIAALNDGYVIVSGSPVLAEFVSFQRHRLSDIEKGILYGYPPTATLAFTGLVPTWTPQPWPESCAEYFLGGVYSRDYVDQERAFFARQWRELQRYAPDICALAQASFESFQTDNAS